MDAFIGEIRQFPFNFAPKNWALCDGQLLAIQSNPALFSIIGTFYGGNGTTTFGLPDLRGHVVTGADPQQSWNIGSTAGTDSVTLLATEMPQHKHLLTGLNNPGTQAAPDSTSYLTFDGRGGTGVVRYMRTNGTPSAAMAPNMLTPAGGNTAHENRQPFLVLNFCIALQGVFPPRN